MPIQEYSTTVPPKHGMHSEQTETAKTSNAPTPKISALGLIMNTIVSPAPYLLIKLVLLYVSHRNLNLVGNIVQS